jgi:Holliday junction DNA helicase RuvB
METGIISETKINKTRQIHLTSWLFATANSYEKIIQPLLSRFAILDVPEYTFEEFTEIALLRLRKEDVNECTARFIAEKVWHELDSRDIRDVIKVARLANDSQRASSVISILKKHRSNQS